MKDFIKQIPVINTIAMGLYRQLRYMAACPSNRRVRQMMKNSRCPEAGRVAEVLQRLYGARPRNESELIAEIERERASMLKSDRSLVEGALGEAGPDDQGRSVGDACYSSLQAAPALFMFLLIREFKPRNVIELGTNCGISSAYMAQALKLNGQGGRLTTLDVSPYRQCVARKLHDALGLDNMDYVTGYFTDTLEGALSDLGEVDFAYIDGHHQFQPTLDYYRQIANFSMQNTLFVFDDIGWSTGMEQAWAEIQKDERFFLVVDLQLMGLCFGPQDNILERFVFPQIRALLG